MRYDETFNQDGFHSALLTGYSFDPVLFRNVILTRMRGHGCRNIAVLVDQDMLNRKLSVVKTAERSGSAYHLAKRAVSGALRDGPVAEIRRFINSCLGLDPREFSDDDELTKAMRKNNTGSGGDGGNGNGDGDGPDGGGADDRPDVAPEYEVLPRGVADERAWRIYDRVDETCEALGMDGVEPLSYLNAIRLHILINVLLKSAAAVGEDIDERRLILLAVGFA